MSWKRTTPTSQRVRDEEGDAVEITGQDEMTTFAPRSEQLLFEILRQLKIMNLHIAELSGSHVLEDDVDMTI